MYFIGEFCLLSTMTTNGQRGIRRYTGLHALAGYIRMSGSMPGQARPSTLAVVVALGTVYIVWGSTYYAIAVMIETLPPLLAAGFRYALAGVLMLTFLLARDRWRRRGGQDGPPQVSRPRLIEWRTTAIVGSLLLLGGNGGVVLGEQRIPSGIAAVIIATTPIWMNVADGLLQRRSPGLLATAGLVVGLLGVALLLYPAQGADALDPIGIGLVVTASLSWAAGTLYARRGALPSNQLVSSGMEMLCGGAALLLVGTLLGEAGQADPGRFSVASVLAVAYLVVIGSLVAFSAYVWLLSHVPISTVSTYAYVNPIVAVALGTMLRGEQITPRMLLAAALIVGAVVAMVSGRARVPEESGPAPEAATLEHETKLEPEG
jgi:drug/metabolite transporter (DMT)-like permease